MFIYFSLYFILIVGAVFDLININKNQRLVIFTLNFVLMYLVASLRYETGIDYYLYEDLFSSSKAIYDIDSLNYFTQDNEHAIEWGYLLLQSLFKIFSDDFSSFIMMYDAILFYFILLGIKINIRYANIQLLIIAFFFLLYYILGMQRQAMAMAIFFSSIRYLLNKNFKEYLLLILFGALFHKVMLIGIIAYFIAHLNIRQKSWVLILTISFLFSYLGLTRYIVNFFYDNFSFLEPVRRLYFYYQVLPDKGNVSFFSYFHRLILCVVILYFYNKTDIKISSLILLSPFCYLIFSDISLLAGRLGGFFLVCYSLYFAHLFSILSEENRKSTIFILFSYLLLYGAINVIKIIFLAVNHLGEKYYVPYESILHSVF